MCLNPIYLNSQHIYVACGKCFECQIKKSVEWSFRIVLEASLYPQNCCITLTYNNEYLPNNNTLCRSDIQKFIKRLRKYLSKDGIKIRYFYCGEYGSLFGRPHFHIIIFNWSPPDKYYFYTDKKGSVLYRSDIVEKLWTYGFSTIGEVTLDTAKYCAKYLQKGLNDKKNTKRSFIGMSLKPGIGAGAIDSKWLLTDKIYVSGKYIKIPNYFLKLFEDKGYSIVTDTIKLKRKQKIFSPSNYDNVLDFEKAYAEYFNSISERRERFSRIFDIKDRPFSPLYYFDEDIIKKYIDI